MDFLYLETCSATYSTTPASPPVGRRAPASSGASGSPAEKSRPAGRQDIPRRVHVDALLPLPPEAVLQGHIPLKGHLGYSGGSYRNQVLPFLVPELFRPGLRQGFKIMGPDSHGGNLISDRFAGREYQAAPIQSLNTVCSDSADTGNIFAAGKPCGHAGAGI